MNQRVELVEHQGVVGHRAERTGTQLLEPLIALFKLGQKLRHVSGLCRVKGAGTLSSNLFWLSLPESENLSRPKSSAKSRAG